jgi:uncharacterized protein DUF4249
MMTIRHSFARASVLLAFCWGCSSPIGVKDPEQVMIVQAFLVPGQDTEVKLRQSLPPERYYAGLEDALTSARVEISTGVEISVLSEDPGERGTYRIAHDAMPVVSGNTYHLQVTDGDRQVRAATEVPFQAEITQFTADTMVYYQYYAHLYGDLLHPGEWWWNRSENAAGYVIIVEAVDVRSLGSWALPLTADLDTLIARREWLEGQVSQDSLERLDRQVTDLRRFLAENISMVDDKGDALRWLRDRDQDDWNEIDLKDQWTEGRKWRERMDELFWNRQVDYWVPADTLRADYWWLGLRFEGEYQITVQAADRNYVDYFTTAGHGHSGADSDRGPLFHVDGGLGVFGSYAEDSFRIQTVRGAETLGMKITARRE